FHMAENRFVEYLESKSAGSLVFQKAEKGCLLFSYQHMALHKLPLKYHLREQAFYFSVKKADMINFPELLIHYLLLYNLSMIARYETEWWSELMKTMPGKDYPFIVSFLEVSAEKGPFLAYQYLMYRLS